MQIIFTGEVPANTTVYSYVMYVGAGNVTSALIGNPTQAVFVKGATSQITITLQAAVILTPRNQSIQPIDSDYITVTNGVYNQDTTASFPSLNGMWLRFQVQNASGNAAVVTCQIV